MFLVFIFQYLNHELYFSSFYLSERYFINALLMNIMEGWTV